MLRKNTSYLVLLLICLNDEAASALYLIYDRLDRIDLMEWRKKHWRNVLFIAQATPKWRAKTQYTNVKWILYGLTPTFLISRTKTI